MAAASSSSPRASTAGWTRSRPTIAWNSLLTALYKEGSVKQGWGSVLGVAGQTAVTGGVTSPAGPQTGGLNPQINQALVEGASTGRFSEQTVAFFRSRGAGPLVERIRVPTLLLQGSADTVFPLSEAMRQPRDPQAQRRAGEDDLVLRRPRRLPRRRRAEHGAREGGGELVRPLPQAQGRRTGPAFQFFPDGGKFTAGATFPPVRKSAISATGRARWPSARPRTRVAAR